MTALLTDDQITAGLARLTPWSLSEDRKSISATIELADFVAALDLVNRIGHEAEQANHHPDIDIRWNRVTLVLSTHSAGGLTAADLDLAERIDDIAGIDRA